MGIGFPVICFGPWTTFVLTCLCLCALALLNISSFASLSLSFVLGDSVSLDGPDLTLTLVLLLEVDSVSLVLESALADCLDLTGLSAPLTASLVLTAVLLLEVFDFCLVSDGLGDFPPVSLETSFLGLDEALRLLDLAEVVLLDLLIEIFVGFPGSSFLAVFVLDVDLLVFFFKSSPSASFLLLEVFLAYFLEGLLSMTSPKRATLFLTSSFFFTIKSQKFL